MKSNAQKLLEKLHQVSLGVPDKVPKGYYPVEWYSKQWNLCHRQAGINLQKGFKAGIVDKKVFRINVSGCLRNVAHYSEI